MSSLGDRKEESSYDMGVLLNQVLLKLESIFQGYVEETNGKTAFEISMNQLSVMKQAETLLMQYLCTIEVMSELANNCNGKTTEARHLVTDLKEAATKQTQSLKECKEKLEYTMEQLKLLDKPILNQSTFEDILVNMEGQLQREVAELENIKNSTQNIESRRKSLQKNCNELESANLNLKCDFTEEKFLTNELINCYSKELSDAKELNLLQQRPMGETIEFTFIKPPSSYLDLSNLILTASFTKKSNLNLSVIKNIQSNLETLWLQDLIEEAIDTNDIKKFLMTVQTRWVQHLPLLKEISQLRNRFPVDWLPERRMLKCILDDAGHVICSLSIPQMYPFEGQVTIDRVDGLPSEQYETLKPKNPCSITSWLDLLSSTFKRNL